MQKILFILTTLSVSSHMNAMLWKTAATDASTQTEVLVGKLTKNALHNARKAIMENAVDKALTKEELETVRAQQIHEYKLWDSQGLSTEKSRLQEKLNIRFKKVWTISECIAALEYESPQHNGPAMQFMREKLYYNARRYARMSVTIDVIDYLRTMALLQNK